MKEQDFYLTIAQTSVEEFKDKGSRFIAYAFPLQSKDAVKKILLELKYHRLTSASSILFL